MLINFQATIVPLANVPFVYVSYLNLGETSTTLRLGINFYLRMEGTFTNYNTPTEVTINAEYMVDSEVIYYAIPTAVIAAGNGNTVVEVMLDKPMFDATLYVNFVSLSENAKPGGELDTYPVPAAG